MFPVLRTIKALKETRNQWQDDVVSLVPTMGSLHKGHLSLIEHALTLNTKVVVSIFVNPTQFGPNEDFDTYPKNLSQDLEILSAYPIDAVFAPKAQEIYPPNYQSLVINQKMAHILCGKTRPHFFGGVCSVVLKLLILSRPHLAIFGKKDYQQLKIIEQMVKDFHLNTRIIGCDIVREQNGLAMSSRNKYLSANEQDIASSLYQSLQAASTRYAQGEKQVKAIVSAAREVICANTRLKLDYLELRQQATLDKLSDTAIAEDPTVLFVAAYLNNVRLIDNIELGPRCVSIKKK